MRRRFETGQRFIRFGFTLLLGLSLAWVAEAQVENDDPELVRLRARIAESRLRVVGHEREERDLVQLLEDVDRGLDEMDSQVEVSTRELEAAQERVRGVDGQLETLESRMQDTRRLMAQRAVALYKAGAEGPLRLLFASQDLREMFSKLWNLERILKTDANLLSHFRSQWAELEDLRGQAIQAQSAVVSTRNRLASRRVALETEKSERRVLLDDVRTNRTRERALLQGLERAALALKETLSGLGKDEAGSGSGLAETRSFASRKGELRRPVRGRVRRPYGRVVDAEYRTQTFRKGVEFSASLGEQVRAVAPGRVRFAGWFRGYGKIVILDHGSGYFTVSGQLSQIRVQVGHQLKSGQVLGTVGETGSLEGPGLYFEVRRGGAPLDPAEWLAKG